MLRKVSSDEYEAKTFCLPSDLDECAPPSAPCSHHCTNTVGSYYCHCRDGFKLDGNSTCLATGKHPGFSPG